jgi:hypothetical protein
MNNPSNDIHIRIQKYKKRREENPDTRTPEEKYISQKKFRALLAARENIKNSKKITESSRIGEPLVGVISPPISPVNLPGPDLHPPNDEKVGGKSRKQKKSRKSKKSRKPKQTRKQKKSRK